MGMLGASFYGCVISLRLDNCILSSRELIASLLPSVFFPSVYSTKIY